MFRKQLMSAILHKGIEVVHVFGQNIADTFDRSSDVVLLTFRELIAKFDVDLMDVEDVPEDGLDEGIAFGMRREEVGFLDPGDPGLYRVSIPAASTDKGEEGHSPRTSRRYSRSRTKSTSV